MQITSRGCDFGAGTSEGSKPCGREAHPVAFAVQGQQHTADLCPRHEEMLHHRVAPFLAVATTLSSRPQLEVRAWLKERGHDVNNRGRIPDSLVALYEQAQGETP